METNKKLTSHEFCESRVPHCEYWPYIFSRLANAKRYISGMCTVNMYCCINWLLLTNFYLNIKGIILNYFILSHFTEMYHFLENYRYLLLDI